MEDLTLAPRQCPRCGRMLPTDAAEGLCAACLFAAGIETLTGSGDDAPTILPSGSEPDGADGDGQRLADGQLWGPYRIGRLLGRGGMGEVYEAEHTETGRRVALKVLRSQLRNAEDRARFLREGQLAASISHPHTVYIFGSEEISGMPVISMELLPGGTLKDLVAAGGPLRPTAAVSAVLDIVGGLDAAQSAGILHRDIKPSNCFLDNEGAVKVGDFGLSISTLARDVRHNVATSGFQGTPQFAPPEQLRGEPLDVRADIYAVGGTLYYLLTGQTPFDAHDLQDLFAQVTSDPPKSPRLVRPDIPQGLASVVLQCLAKTPAERPPSYAALADALRPYSSRDDAPARPGQRLVAGILDSLLIGLPVGLSLTSSNVTQAGSAAARASAWLWLINFAYYLSLEGLWGASLGKRLFGLRVTSIDGAAAPWARIFRRTLVFHVPSMLVGSLVIAGVVTSETPLAAQVRGAVGLALIAALFLTARRHNGWAALHDLASATRVVSRSAVGARRATASQERTGPPVLAENVFGRARRYGPFTVVSEVGDTGGGRLIVGFDPLLRRAVWIHTVPQDTPAISAARRDVSRVGRLHWLTGRRSASESWDAFEAPDGRPLLTRSGSASGWPAMKLWLLDLAHELTAGARDGSTPTLGLDRLWLRNDGHLVLLDFPASSVGPGPGESPAADLTPVGLLSAIARGADDPAEAGSRAGEPVIPLSARSLLDRWSRSEPSSLDAARDELIEVAAAPDRVWRWRRAIPIALASAPILFVTTSALLVLPPLYRFLTPENAEMVGLLDALNQPNPPANSRLGEPEYRAAVEIYLAGRYGAVLKDQGFWNAAIMQSRAMNDRRRIAAEIVMGYPSVPVEELTRASQLTAPERERASQRRLARQADGGGLGAIIIGVLTALGVVFSLGCSMVSSVIMPGGVVTRLLGLAVVTRDGTEIRRWRSAARTLVAWLPAIVWLAWLATSPRIQGFVPTRAAVLPVAGLARGALALGAAWAIARPTRGPHDWVMRTWIVPR